MDILTTDHREVTDLLLQIRTATDAATRRDLADTMISELVRHAVAEEMYVYPAMKQHLPDGEASVEHDIAEHKELEQTMKELEAVEPSDPRFDSLLAELETTLADHVADEESDQFPKLRASIPQEELVQLGGEGADGQEAGPDPAASRRAQRRAVPQGRRPGRRPRRPAARPPDGAFDLVAPSSS